MQRNMRLSFAIESQLSILRRQSSQRGYHFGGEIAKGELVVSSLTGLGVAIVLHMLASQIWTLQRVED